MSKYSNFVIQSEMLPEKMKLAGYHEQWGKAMLLGEGTNIGNITGKGKSASIVIPASAVNTERTIIRNQVDKCGVYIRDEICSSLAVIDFYINQGSISNRDRNICVVDMWSEFTDVCFIKNEPGIRSIREVHRIDFGFLRLEELMMDFFAEQLKMRRIEIGSEKERQKLLCRPVKKIVQKMLYSRTSKQMISLRASDENQEYQLQICRREFDEIIGNVQDSVIAELRCIRMKHRIQKEKLLLSGELFEYAGAVKHMKTRVSGAEVLSYKAENAAVLGAVCYSRKKHGRNKCCVIDNWDVFYSQQIKRGAYSNLTIRQQNIYQRIRDSIREKRSEVNFEGSRADIVPVYRALETDCPETDIVWEHMEASFWEYKAKSTIKLELEYKVDGEKKLDEIKRKAEQIIAGSVVQKNMTDTQILEAVYYYMAHHYHYTNEQLPNGEFPEHAYTLEALLKQGVCRGYALSMLYICRLLQIPVIYISGVADGREFGGHAWNIVQTAEGSWRHFDMTWDLRSIEGNMCHLLLDDLGMKARRHFWEALKYPECT